MSITLLSLTLSCLSPLARYYYLIGALSAGQKVAGRTIDGILVAACFTQQRNLTCWLPSCAVLGGRARIGLQFSILWKPGRRLHCPIRFLGAPSKVGMATGCSSRHD